MKSYLYRVAEKFEQKLSKISQTPIVTQNGTTELFFENERNQRAFNSAIQSGPLAKFLTDVATKTQKTAGFDLKVKADPGKGAAWLLSVVPTSLQGNVSKLLDAEFRKITGKGMSEVQKNADVAAKGGAGSGTLPIGSFSAEF